MSTLQRFSKASTCVLSSGSLEHPKAARDGSSHVNPPGRATRERRGKRTSDDCVPSTPLFKGVTVTEHCH